MKTLSKALCLLALPAAASAQVSLIAGWNFGQFIGNTVPSTNGLTGEAVGSIPSNYAGFTRPGPGTSGPEQSGVSATPFSAGTGVISWDGSNGSDSWAYVDGTGVYVNNDPETYSSVNGNLVTNNDLNSGQDGNGNWQLRFTASPGADAFAITVNTASYADYNDAAYSQTNDFNFSFAAYGSGSVTFFYDGANVGSSFVVGATETAYNLNLPASFYGKASSTLIAQVSDVGAINFDNIQINGVAIPETTSYAAMLGLAGLTLAALRRRK